MIALAILTLAPQDFGPEAAAVERLPILRNVATGDLDGDGDLDLVAVGSDDSGVIWHENIGGAFRVQEPLAPNDDTLGRFAVAAADVDGDGDDDVLIAGFASPALAWIESLGGGEFSPSREIPSNNAVGTSIQTADFDGDGDQDFVVIAGVGSLTFYSNDGSGNFSVSQAFIASGPPIGSIAVGDLDSDGDPDVAYSFFNFFSTNEIQILRNDGGTFVGPLSAIPPTDTPDRLRIVDVDGDGALDVAVSVLGSRSIRWSRNIGGMTFAPFAGAYDPPSQIRDHEWSDVDNDGIDDIVVSEQPIERTIWVRNTGAGFEAPRLITDEQPNVRRIAIADFDGDGAADAALASGREVGVVLDAASALAPVLRLSVRLDTQEGAAVGDLDGDGISELVVVNGPTDGAPTGNSFSVRSGLTRRVAGSTSFGEELQRLDLPGVRSVEIIDLDGDGASDIVAVSSDTTTQLDSLAWSRQLPSGAFQSPVVLRSDTSGNAARYALGDADADGDLDILWNWSPSAPLGGATWEAQWLVQSASGNFVAGVDIDSNRITGRFRLADVDADGDADVVRIVSTGTERVEWDRNLGDGLLGAASLVTNLTFALRNDIQLGDLDHDGRIDLAVFQPTGVSWHRSLATGEFDLAQTIALFPLDQPIGLLVDLNDDGLPEIVASGGMDVARLLRNLGGGTFSAPEAVPGRTSGSGAIAAADLDGDRDLDLLKWLDRRALAWNENDARVGDAYCGPAVPNSTGSRAFATSSGSTSIASNDLVLRAGDMPPGSFGHFLVGRAGGFTPTVQNSQGALCLSGPIGRLNRSQAEMFQASASGNATVAFDVTDVPTPTGSIALAHGDTLYFQAWYRDANPMVTSNFTNGVRVTFGL